MKYLLILALLTLTLPFAAAQNIDFTATAPAKITAEPCRITESSIAVTNLADFQAGFSFSIEGNAKRWANIADGIMLKPMESGSVKLYLNIPCGTAGEYGLETRIHSDLNNDKVLKQTITVPSTAKEQPTELIDFSWIIAPLNSLNAKLLIYTILAILLLVILLAIINLLVRERREESYKPRAETKLQAPSKTEASSYQPQATSHKLQEEKASKLPTILAILLVIAAILVIDYATLKTGALRTEENITANDTTANATTNATKTSWLNASLSRITQQLMQDIDITPNLNITLPQPPKININKSITLNLGFLEPVKGAATIGFNTTKPYLPYTLAGLIILIIAFLAIRRLEKREQKEELYTSVKIPKIKKTKKKTGKPGIPPKILIAAAAILLIAAMILAWPYYKGSLTNIQIKKITLPSMSFTTATNTNMTTGISEATATAKDFIVNYAAYIAAGIIILFLLIIIMNRMERKGGQ